MFGGIGMTDEDTVLYMKRTRVAEMALSDASYDRECCTCLNVL